MKILSLLMFLIWIPSIKAEIVFLPESRHQQYRTYGLFIDQQSSLMLRDSGKAWGALGGAITLAELTTCEYKPQLTAHGSANAAMVINSAGNTLLTQTIDARVGLSADFEFTPEWRGTLIWTHQSGHISDNVPDADLIGSNLGNEILTLRFIRDIDQRWRIGAGIRAAVASDPGMQGLGGEQFVEWFPYQFSDNPHHLNPYISLGTEEYGRAHEELSFNAQVGLAAGNHFLPKKFSALRLVLGYYNGIDPRLKYFQFKRLRSEFGYAGLMFDI